jgi:hypothetical protein
MDTFVQRPPSDDEDEQKLNQLQDDGQDATKRYSCLSQPDKIIQVVVLWPVIRCLFIMILKLGDIKMRLKIQ